ncbi:MAG: hypothetical protein JW801_04135 [Bacteroidales bacterium]|nr:hypothetical protein [Bacteroidales bacterium]
MHIHDDEQFIKGVESLIDPMAVSDLLFLQKLKGILPSPIMKRLLLHAAKKTPRIGFVIEPYSLFLFFRLKDIEAARKMLPERYELARTKLFEDDEPDFFMGIGNLGTRASSFWGARQECYLIATDKESGLLSFIFIEILSNTLIALPPKGITNPNCEKAVFTTSAKGDIFVDMKEKKTSRQFTLRGNIKRGKLRKLDQNLWLMGNTSIAHSQKLAGGDYRPFAVIFDPAEVAEALDIPTEDVSISKNTLFPGLAESEPVKVICFPYAQHYVADSPGCYTTVKDRDELVSIYNQLGDPGKLKIFSAKTILIQLLAGVAVSVLIVFVLSLIL